MAAGDCRAEPAFLGLVEPFDLALGLGVERVAVLLGDAEGGQQVLEGVPAAAEAGGADAPVVRQGRGGQPVSAAGLQERVDHDLPGDRGMDAAAEQVARVVVEPVDDLRVRPAGQGPVGEVGLPALVRLGRLEAQVGGPGPLAGLGGDQPGGVQDPADRRGRGDVQPGLLQVPGDGDRPGVPAGRGQLEAGLDDELADLVLRRLRAALRPAGPGLDRLQPARLVPGHETVQVLAGVPVLGGRGRDRKLLADDLQDRHACSRHGTRLSPMSRLTCRVSTVTYLVNPDTITHPRSSKPEGPAGRAAGPSGGPGPVGTPREKPGRQAQKLPGFWTSPVPGGLRPQIWEEFGLARETAPQR